ncbi:MAG TPA: phosphoribosylamine--glycine ligase [Gammaproteobacteria bacterium]|nr:phosphoribosylamine--glycine ligase [Gammaproteobacteria bacterium]
MNILIIGNGGREHALAWKVRQSPEATRVFVAPGNAGTALEPGIENIPINATDIPKLIDFAKKQHIDLTIVGPEAPLAAGIADEFQQQQLPCFAPSQAAARLESSKAYSKDFMARYHIPTAHYATFTDLSAAITYIKQQSFPLVIKADGLAAGKGVVIAQSESQAQAFVQEMLSGQTLGNAGQQIVIEEFIQGEEASFIVMADGTYALPLVTSQDHKTRDDGDTGPNTGGMGAYSPAPVITSSLHAKIMETVIYPTLRGLAAQGTPYTGFLYAGLMITPQNAIKVLEFNCRLGDPETQVILMRLQSDLVSVCLAALHGQLNTVKLLWDQRPALGVVLAAKGYPDRYAQGDVIQHLSEAVAADCKVFHAGTVLDNEQVKTAGGRVLCATALGDSIKDAQFKAYALAKQVSWENAYYRRDIGYRAIMRE